MNSPPDSTDSKASRTISKSLPGPDFSRYYPAHRLMAWQPQGTLDDLMLNEIADWLVDIEKVFPPFKRFIDFSQLTTVAVRPGHVFKVARRRAQQFTGVEPVRTALFSDDLVTLAIARLYESLMGGNADRGAGIFRSRQSGGMARHSSRRSNAEG
jgi:hypothetical protein